MSNCCMANKILKLIKKELNELEICSRFKWETVEYYNKIDIQIRLLENLIEKIEKEIGD